MTFIQEIYENKIIFREIEKLTLNASTLNVPVNLIKPA